MSPLRVLSGALLVLLLVGCGAGGGDGGDAASTPSAVTTMTTTYYPSGRIHEQGPVLSADGTRTGEWVRYFDEDGAPKQWHGSYAADAVDDTRPWTEWNRDGSVRVDSTDH